MSTASQRLGRRLERGLLLAYLLLLPIMALASVRVAGLYLIPSDWLFPLLALAAASRGVRPWPRDHHDLLLLAYPLVVGAAVLGTASGGGLSALAVAVYLSALAWLAARAGGRSVDRDRLAAAWVAAAVGSAVLALVGSAASVSGLAEPDNPLLAGHGSLPPWSWARPRALFFGTNTLASFLVVGAALAWHRWRHGSRRDGGALCLIVIACLTTLSPGFGALLAVLALMAGLDSPRGTGRRRAAWLLAGLCALATVAIAAVDVAGLLSGVIRPSVRFHTWAAAAEVFARHPLLGAGPEDPGIVVWFRAPDGALQRLVDAHSVPLDVLARTGIAGLAVLGALVGTAVARGIRGAGQGGGLRVALAVAVVGTWGIQGLTGSFQETRHLWLLLGLLVAAGRDGTATAHPAPDAGISAPSARPRPPG